VLLALAGAGLWLVLARAAPVTVRVAARARGLRGGGRRLRARRQRLRHRASPGHRVGQDHRQGDEVLIEEGMRVEEGAVLARLDDTEAKAQLALAQAQLAAARSQVAEIRTQLEQAEREQRRQQEIFDRQAPLASARSAAVRPRALRWPRSRRRSSRPRRSTSARKSSTTGSSSPRRRSTPRARSATPCGRGSRERRAGPGGGGVRRRRRGEHRAGPGDGAAQRDTLRAKLAASAEAIRVAQEGVAVAEVQVANTVVRAPFGGMVIAKSAQPGEMISPISAGGGFTRTGIGTIVDMDSLEIQVDVNEAFINRVTPGQPVEAMLNAYPDSKLPGAVIAIIPTADRSKAT
jgi:multidrug resistance efflux pump